MDRVAIFVDAGYFWTQLTQVVYGSRSRGHEKRIKSTLNYLSPKDYKRLHLDAA